MNAGFLHQALLRAGVPVSWCDSTGAVHLQDGSARQATVEEVDAALLLEQRAQVKPVTRRQMLTALHRAGLLTTIKGAVAASGNVELQIAFDESQEFQRDNAFLAAMAQSLGKTDAEIDAIFALAATI